MDHLMAPKRALAKMSRRQKKGFHTLKRIGKNLKDQKAKSGKFPMHELYYDSYKWFIISINEVLKFVNV